MALSRSEVDSLKAALQGAIDTYLVIDNPEPGANAGFLAKAAAAALSLYTHQGKPGRVRARAYKDSIGKSEESCNALFMRVINDIKRGDSCLDTSIKLRMRLLKGLCAYAGLSDDAINCGIDETRISMTKALVHASAQAYAAMPSEAEIQTSAMLTLLQPKIQAATQDLHYEKSMAAIVAGVARNHQNRSLISNSSL